MIFKFWRHKTWILSYFFALFHFFQLGQLIIEVNDIETIVNLSFYTIHISSIVKLMQIMYQEVLHNSLLTH